jgi:hypothetical protein
VNLSATNIDVDQVVASVTGNVGGAVSGSVGSVDGNVVGSVGSIASGGIVAGSFAPGAIDAGAIATDAIGSNEIAASAVTKIQAGLATPTNITAGTITTATNLTNAPTAGDLTATMKASVNAEVLDVLNVDTFAELGAVPAATSSLKDKLTYMFMWFRNKSTQTSTTRLLRNDADNATVATETVSDDGTTYTKGEAS